MSIRLRPMGKPCLRSPRGALLVVAGAVALVTAPATTAYANHVKPLGWYAEEAAAPATVQFEDVAASPEAQLAVGSDTDAITGLPAAVIYRRGLDSWQPETLSAPGDSELLDVEIAGSAAWAVGRAGADPLVMRLTAEGAWEPVSLGDAVPAEAGAATAVAIGSSSVTIGDDQGNLYTVSSAGVTRASAPLAGAINGIDLLPAVTGETVPGYAAAGFDGQAPDGTARIYELRPAPLLEPADAVPAAELNITGVAATRGDHAVAIDPAATWRIDQDGVWRREAAGLPTSASLDAVAAAPGGQFVDGQPGWGTEFLVGEAPPATSGSTTPETAIWQRTRWGHHPQSWARVTVPAGTPALAGVAATAWDNAWGVGANGAVVRWWRPPDPDAHHAAEQAAAEAERQRLAEEQRLYEEQLAAEEAERQRLAADQVAAEQAAADQAAADQAAADQAAADQAAGEQQAAETSTAPPPPAPTPVEQDNIRMNGVVIDDREPDTRTGKRLLKNVRVVRRGQRLIVSFRLTAKARVRLVAKRGKRVISKTRVRTLRKGRRKLVLRFSGAPPTSLKVVVRRVSGARDNR